MRLLSDFRSNKHWSKFLILKCDKPAFGASAIIVFFLNFIRSLQNLKSWVALLLTWGNNGDCKYILLVLNKDIRLIISSFSSVWIWVKGSSQNFCNGDGFAINNKNVNNGINKSFEY